MREKKKFDIEQQGSTNPNKSDFLSKIPSWLKVFILKYWAAAAACFFVGMGGAAIGLDYSLIAESESYWLAIEFAFRFYVFLVLFTALVMNYIVKPFTRMMHSSKDNTKRFLVVNKKGFLGFLLQLGYVFLVMIPIFFITIYIGQFNLLPNLFGKNTQWGLEPFSMGLFFTFVDLLFLLVKNSIIAIYKRYRVNKINSMD